MGLGVRHTSPCTRVVPEMAAVEEVNKRVRGRVQQLELGVRTSSRKGKRAKRGCDRKGGGPL